MELPPHVHRIRLPLSFRALRSANAYLIEGTDGCTLVDCGWDTDEGLEALRTALRELGHDLSDVATLVVTHYHGDHAGLARRVVELAGCRFLIHRVDWQYYRSNVTDPQVLARETIAWLERHGMSFEGWGDEAKARMFGGAQPVLPEPDALLEDGDRIRVGGRELHVYLTPGHTEGHICLYDPVGRGLFSGDHILDPINPHVGARPGTEGALAPYLAALERVAELEVDVVLPGHGEPFSGLKRRVEKLLAHHRQRREAVLNVLAKGPSTAGEIAAVIPWTAKRLTFDQLPPLNRRIALAQVLCHLEMLRGEGLVSRTIPDGRVYYRRA